MEAEAVGSSYRRWAPIYDHTFGRITRPGRRRAVEYVNTRSGSVLEVGVGTGLTLPEYAKHLRITGMDYSHEMLAKAQDKVERLGLEGVEDLRQMDARELDYPDAAFDTVVGMYLVSVVPEPERVIAEMARVCKPGGEVVILNHFARDRGFLAWLERVFAPFANLLGWHSDFRKERIMGAPGLELKDETAYPPFGMFTLLRFVKSG